MNEATILCIFYICYIGGMIIAFAFFIVGLQISTLKRDRKYLEEKVKENKDEIYKLKDEIRDLKYKLPRKD